ncbi:MAG: TVP38/TMEM64 family protein [Candidatus Limivicinus sp.]|jgi:uncharacterized membrane protein YdjX (TVP38/TMEM64 family)
MKTFKKILRALPLAVSICCVAVYLIMNPDITAEKILEYTPAKPWLAAAVLWLFYGIKSMTVFFPLVVLEVAGGLLFPTWIALAVNEVGILICLSIPYFIGRTSGMEAVGKLVSRYPRLSQFMDIQQENSLLVNILLRVSHCLPGDLISMYMGASGVPCWQNLLGGSIGILPGMTLATLVGTSIEDPSSPVFWLSAGLMVVISILSLVISAAYNKKRKKSKREESGETAG